MNCIAASCLLIIQVSKTATENWNLSCRLTACMSTAVRLDITETEIPYELKNINQLTETETKKAGNLNLHLD